MLKMIQAAAMKNEPETHWFVPDTATKVPQPVLAASASRELKEANIIISPSNRITIPHDRTNILLPARKKVIAAPIVCAFTFWNRRDNVAIDPMY